MIPRVGGVQELMIREVNDKINKVVNVMESNKTPIGGFFRSAYGLCGSTGSWDFWVLHQLGFQLYSDGSIMRSESWWLIKVFITLLFSSGGEVKCSISIVNFVHDIMGQGKLDCQLDLRAFTGSWVNSITTSIESLTKFR
ncbi:hypothetical protein F8M41_003659 [Gigaspora margarita]|uniref:Uncharacterized protein n=1 Tax=Gigaspora margarita TaxID=4874 RepID=A0A8H3XBQ7_GIGMA|nr:hypothetical protein F8M41_003659 [Gigaspora margarita]